MIDKFGQIMIYVKDTKKVSEFWINNLGFKEVSTEQFEGKIVGIELSPYELSDTNIVLYDAEFVAKTSPMLNLSAPSILFSTYSLEKMHTELKNKGIAVGDITMMSDRRVFNFPDNEGNYFAVREIKK